MWAPNVHFGQDSQWDYSEAAEPSAVSAHALIKGALAVAAAFLILLLLAPDVDTAVSQLFYRGDHFIGGVLPLFGTSRTFFNILFYVTCAATVIGLIVAGRSAGRWLGFPFNAWLFMAVALVVGPLIVANLGFKDHWGRARPRDVIEFGGAKAFTPAFRPSDQCSRNCSFVSGEASSVYVVFFAAAFMLRRRARRLIALGVVFGSLAGLTRIAQGGHFLSDVVFAGVFMALSVACLQLLFDAIRAGETGTQEAVA
jgi:lipid A 4'-phosphatase